MARRRARGDVRLDVVLLAGALLVGVIALALPDPRADAVAAGLRRTVLAPLASVHRRAERARHALSADDSVSMARDSLALRALDAGRLEYENERLRALLSLGARLRTGFVPAEAVHARALGEEHVLVLSAGASAGVTQFSPVISAEGVVGYVRSVAPRSSVAIVWPHPDFRVSAMVADGSAWGVVLAHLGDGAARYLLELRGVPFRTELAPGTLIVSSGLGGTFPRGVPVGTVIRQLSAQEGWARDYLLMPAVNAGDVGAVLVLSGARAAADLSSVWTDPDSAAAATRSAVAAGDSLRREAAATAAAAAAARAAQRTADSLRVRMADSLRIPPVDSLRAPPANSLRMPPADSSRNFP